MKSLSTYKSDPLRAQFGSLYRLKSKDCVVLFHQQASYIGNYLNPHAMHSGIVVHLYTPSDLKLGQIIYQIEYADIEEYNGVLTLQND